MKTVYLTSGAKHETLGIFSNKRAAYRCSIKYVGENPKLAMNVIKEDDIAETIEVEKVEANYQNFLKAAKGQNTFIIKGALHSSTISELPLLKEFEKETSDEVGSEE